MQDPSFYLSIFYPTPPSPGTSPSRPVIKEGPGPGQPACLSVPAPVLQGFSMWSFPCCEIRKRVLHSCASSLCRPGLFWVFLKGVTHLRLCLSVSTEETLAGQHS